MEYPYTSSNFHQENQEKNSVLDGQSPPPTGPTSRPENPGDWHRVTFHDPVALRQLENIGTYPDVLPLDTGVFDLKQQFGNMFQSSRIVF